MRYPMQLAFAVLFFLSPCLLLADDLKIDAGQMQIEFRRTDGGLEPASIFDSTARVELAAAKQPPLFEITLRQPHGEEARSAKLVADRGWSKVDVTREDNTNNIVIRFSEPTDPQLAGLSVVVRQVTPSGQELAWTIEVENDSKRWSLGSVIFPQVALADQGERMTLLIPSCAGKIEVGVCRRKSYQFRNAYPNGWCTLAFEAAYDEAKQVGFYFAMHDPKGSYKKISAKVDPAEDSLIFAFEHLVPDDGKPGVGFTLPGSAAWQLFKGDWFDASMIYRGWVRDHAAWYPKLTDEGRADTPLWMRELPAWAQMRGKPETVVPAVKRFQEYLGVPVGIHWYDWHQIPYDNDYPHYFPAVDGFVEGVAELQRSNVRVMPYINGRLWDTRDRGLEDFEFTSKGLGSAALQESGKPYIEEYNSKEKDGSHVRLAPMCPATKLWQETVGEVVAHHFREHNVNGVYIDQIGAASPKPCYNQAHGHPLGGGSWWNEGYWKMLDAIRSKMPKDRMITTECNAEPFLRWFDGYLSWHWQNDGQVPAFPAVYGGTIQMFGRAYPKDSGVGLAMRMKVGEELCYGEQIGWISPTVIDNDKVSAPFLRQLVQLRYAFRRYFYAGEMCRPPKLEGDVPKVTADWRWGGSRMVTTPAVLTGAWWLPKENRAIILLVNVSDKPVTADVVFNPSEYLFDGLSGKSPVKVTVLKGDEVDKKDAKPQTFTLDEGRRRMTLPPLSAQAWELTVER